LLRTIVVVMEVNTHYAKTHLSRLIEKAKLVFRIAAGGKRRKLGSARGQIWLGKGWDAPLTDEEIEQLTGE
jgi:hypothetical protein